MAGLLLMKSEDWKLPAMCIGTILKELASRSRRLIGKLTRCFAILPSTISCCAPALCVYQTTRSGAGSLELLDRAAVLSPLTQRVGVQSKHSTGNSRRQRRELEDWNHHAPCRSIAGQFRFG